MRGPANGRFIREHPMKMDDLGVPLVQETSIIYEENPCMFDSIDAHCISLNPGFFNDDDDGYY